MTILFNDFETKSRIDINKSGHHYYARDKSTRVLMCAFAFDNEKVQQWVPAEGQKMPRDLLDAIRDPKVKKSAFNAPFEIAIWKHVLDEEIFIEEWRCTQVHAMTLSFPGKLEKVGPIVDLPVDKQKDARGKALIRKFCMPRTPTAKMPWEWNTYITHPDEWEEFKDYNRQDIIAERAIYNRIRGFPVPQHEWEMWMLDQEINDDGIPINLHVMNRAIEYTEHCKDSRRARIKKLTGVENPRSNPQMLEWLREQGYRFDDLKAGHVKRAAEDKRLSEKTREVLTLRAEVAKTSTDKYYAMERSVDPDDAVIRGCFQFAGAPRTWRWSGRIIQPQNLARPHPDFEKVQPQLVADLARYDNKTLDLLYEKTWSSKGTSAIDMLSTAIRPTIQAPDGETTFSADSNAIENRVLGYLSGDRKILGVFARGEDPYIDFAGYMYDTDYETEAALYDEGNGDKSHRTISKPGVLGCLGPDTPVLTDAGWVRLVDITSNHKVHDGDTFVEHGGVAYRGHKEVLSWNGIHVTPDHLFEIDGQWVQCQQVLEQSDSAQAVSSAVGRLSNLSTLRALREHGTDADALAVRRELLGEETSPSARQHLAIRALRNCAVQKSGCEWVQNCTTFSQIVSTLREAGAKTKKIRITDTTAGEVFAWRSIVQKIGSNTSSMCSEQTEGWRSTGKITTGIIGEGTCDSQLDPSKTLTRDTWDVVDAGPNHRFVVMTDVGPMISHNCGYMLSAGEEYENDKTGEIEATGLLGYAWNMGVSQFTLEDAEKSVKVWRGTFKDAVEYWWTIQKAALRTIRTGKESDAGPVYFDRKGPFMRMWLPSGRALHYVRPRIEENRTYFCNVKRKYLPEYLCKQPDYDDVRVKESITYEGLDDRKNWRRITTHPGKLTENADQAISRDILAEAMKRFRRRVPRKEGRLRIHVHDELVGIGPIKYAERNYGILVECMSEEMPWATQKELPLAAKGGISKVWIKD